MADIHQIHNETGISVRSLNKLERAGYLRVTKTDSPEASKMLTNLRKKNPLTAGQLVMLYQEPKLFDHLAGQEYAARDALDAMGDIDRDRAPIEIAGMLADCASKDAFSVNAVASWLKQHMDASPDYVEAKPYRYVAVRLMASLQPHILKLNLKSAAQAILQIRKHRLLDGYSFMDAAGKTFFQKPKITLDL